MSQLNTPLRAIATPVDIFAPEGVAPPAEDQRLSQLASSLSGFSDTLGRFAAAENEEDREEGLKLALEEQRKLRLDNIAEFDRLRKEGVITEGENPHKLKFLRKLVARNQAISTALTVEANFSAADLDNPDDIAAVRQEFRGRILEGLGELSASEFQAAAGQVDSATESFTTRYKRRRERERVLETDEQLQAAVQSTFSTDAEGADKLVRAFQQPEGSEAAQLGQRVVQELQDLSDAAVSNTPAPRVREQMLAAVELAAVQTRNPELAQELMERLTVDGVALSEVAPAGYLDEIRESVENEELAADRRELARVKMDRREASREIQSVLAESDNPLTAQLPPELKERYGPGLSDIRQSMAADRAETLLSRSSSRLLAGNLGDEGFDNALEAMVALGSPGHTAMNRLTRLRASLSGEGSGFADTVNARALRSLRLIEQNENLTVAEKLDQIVQLQESGQLTKDDFENTVRRVVKSDESGPNTVSRAITAAQTKLDELVFSGIEYVYGGTGRLVPDPEQVRRLETMKSELAARVSSFAEQSLPGPDELDGFIDKVLTESVNEFGIAQPERADARTTSAARDLAETTHINPEDWTTRLKFGDEGFVYQVGNAEPIPRVAPDTGVFGEVNRQLPNGDTVAEALDSEGTAKHLVLDVMTRLGIDPNTDPQRALRFIDTQIRAYPRTAYFRTLKDKLQNRIGE